MQRMSLNHEFIILEVLDFQSAKLSICQVFLSIQPVCLADNRGFKEVAHLSGVCEVLRAGFVLLFQNLIGQIQSRFGDGEGLLLYHVLEDFQKLLRVIVGEMNLLAEAGTQSWIGGNEFRRF